MTAILNALDHGIDLRSDTNQAPRLQPLLDELGNRGGGTLLIPAGRILASSLFLRDGTTLRLEGGAELAAWPDLDDYPTHVQGHNKDRQPYHFLIADGAKRVTLCGDGTLDGQGPKFWEPRRPEDVFSREKKRRISPMLEFTRCEDVRIEGVRIVNSPGWTVHLHECDRVWVRGITMLNDLWGPNTDGLDINGCRDVFVSDSLLVCGDDAIVLKTTPDSRSCERVTVTNCVVQSNCAALKLGYGESFHDFRQIAFSNCVVRNSHRAVALYVCEGATIEDVAVSNVVCDTLTPLILAKPIHIGLERRRPDSKLGRIRSVQVSNLIARTSGRILLTGADGGRLENIVLRDVAMVYPVIEDPDPAGRFAKSTQSSRTASPEVRCARAAVAAENVDGLVVDGLSVTWPDGDPPAEWTNSGTRIQNGGDGVVEPGQYNSGPPPFFHQVWGRGLRDEVIRLRKDGGWGGAEGVVRRQ